MTRTETTVSPVERVVFLRKAPLFAALPPQDLQPVAEAAEEHLFREGDVIGEMSVISSRPRVASLRAKSDVRVLEIHKPAFEAILRERPDTALALMRVLCERLAPDDPATD